MLKIYIFFVLISITIFITNSELSEEIKKNIKFVCGEAIVVGGGSGHIDGPGNRLAAIQRDSFPINFTVKKPITKEDNLTLEYGGQCGHRSFLYPAIINICDILDSKSDDETRNLYKAFIDLLGFNVSSSCPIPTGTYTLKQQNDFNPWLSDFFGSECSESDDPSGNCMYGSLLLHLMKENYWLMGSSWHQIKLNGIDNCTLLDSVIRRDIERELTHFMSQDISTFTQVKSG